MPVTPHIKDGYAPLRELIKRAIRRFGDFTAESVQGDVENMFIEFANMIVLDYQTHPYYNDRAVEEYTSVDEAKAIDDRIMLAGLLAHYSFQQSSEKTPGYQTLYYKTLNQIMWDELNGNTPINMRPTDGGSNRDDAVLTKPVNGLPVESDDDEVVVTTQ